MGRHSTIERIRREDPSYDPIGPACERAGIGRELFKAAFDRVVIDGNFGPIRADDWKEQDGREPSTVSEGLKILAAVSEEIEDYRESAYVECPYCDGAGSVEGETCSECEEGFVLVDETTYDASDIRRDVFSAVVEIYGSLPF